MCEETVGGGEVTNVKSMAVVYDKMIIFQQNLYLKNIVRLSLSTSLFSMGYPALYQADQPPLSAYTFGYPFSRK